MQQHMGGYHSCSSVLIPMEKRAVLGNDCGVSDDSGGNGYDDEQEKSAGCGG